MNMYQGSTTASLALAAAMEHIPAEIREALLRLERLSTLPRRCLVAVAEAAEVVEYRAGSSIIGRDSQPVVLFLLQGRVIVKHSNGRTMRHDAVQEPVARPLYRAGEEVEIIALRSARLLKIPNAVYVRQLSLAASEPRDEVVTGESVDDGHDGLERALAGGILSMVPSEQVRLLLLDAEEQTVQAGDPVYAQGDPANGYYVVLHGAVEVFRHEADGRRVRVAVLGPGECFGEEALILELPRPESAHMLASGALLRITQEAFANCLLPTQLRTLVPREATALVNAGGCWLDVRESSTQAIELARFAVKMPLSTLRVKRSTLSADRAYIVYANDPRREALACFLLSEIGLSAFTLDGQVEQLGPATGASTDDLMEEELFNGLALPALEPILAGTASAEHEGLEAMLPGGSVFRFMTEPPGQAPETGDCPVADAEKRLIFEPLTTEFCIPDLGGDAAPPVSAPELAALLDAERVRFERRLAQKLADLRLVARRKAKEVVNRRTEAMRARVLARIGELRAERRVLQSRLRAAQAEQAALAAERQALAEARAALDAERSALAVERARLDRKRAASKRLASRRARAGAGKMDGGTAEAGD